MDALRHELTTTDVVDTGVPSRSRPGSACLVGTDQLGEGGSLAQCAELTWQLRGTADARQVDGAQVALQHNLGLGGAAVVTAYRRPVL